jgi:hypothetical protein
MSNRFVDGLITYRILKMLVTPFEETDAFRLGIIDKKGKLLKTKLDKQEELESYTLLHRLVFRMKRIIEKIPTENKKLTSIAAALALIREGMEKHREDVDLEMQFINKATKPLAEEKTIVNKFFSEQFIRTFKQYSEDAAIANTSGSVIGTSTGAKPTYTLATDPVGGKPKGKSKKLDMFRRKSNA